MVKDLKIEVAISDLEHFVEQKEKEEKEKRRKEGIPEEESTISSQNIDEINEENINREIQTAQVKNLLHIEKLRKSLNPNLNTYKNQD